MLSAKLQPLCLSLIVPWQMGKKSLKSYRYISLLIKKKVFWGVANICANPAEFLACSHATFLDLFKLKKSIRKNVLEFYPICFLMVLTVNLISEKMKSSGIWFNIKMPSYQYRQFHSVGKMILRPSYYLHNGISYTGKTSLYWIRSQGFISVLHKTFDHKIISHKAAQFNDEMVRSLWNLTDAFTIVLLGGLSKFRAMGRQDFARSSVMMSYIILIWFPGERRLAADTHMLALLKVNPNADWVIRTTPEPPS